MMKRNRQRCQPVYHKFFRIVGKMDALPDIGGPSSIGILAYGSLIGRPGAELEPHIIYRKKRVLTTFELILTALLGDKGAHLPFRKLRASSLNAVSPTQLV